jgi:zinc protease
VRLILLEKHDLPSVTISARITAGSNQDTDAEAGLADMTARMLDEGTHRHDYNAISSALEQVGASFSATTSRETTDATLQALSRYAGDLVPLFAELLRSPSFPGDRLEQERSRRLVELQEELDDAGIVARQEFNKLVYGAHPAHRPAGGTPQTVKALTQGALERFHERYYRPDATTLIAVGDFRTQDLLDRLTAAFGDWTATAPATSEPLPAVQRQAEARSTRIVMEKAQTQIVLGHLGITRTNPDFLPLKVMDTILGEGVSGGFTARIPYQLRDVQGLAYTVGSSITSSAGREPGVFVAALGTEPKNEKTAVAALLKEIRKIRAAPVTPQELSEAERYLADSYVFSFQTNAQLAAYLDAVQYYGLGYNYRQQFVRDVRKVSRADVERVAQKYLDPEHVTLVVVGPTKAP